MNDKGRLPWSLSPFLIQLSTHTCTLMYVLGWGPSLWEKSVLHVHPLTHKHTNADIHLSGGELLNLVLLSGVKTHLLCLTSLHTTPLSIHCFTLFVNSGSLFPPLSVSSSTLCNLSVEVTVEGHWTNVICTDYFRLTYKDLFTLKWLLQWCFGV